MNRRQYIAYRVGWAGVASLLVSFALFVVATSIGDITNGPEISPALPDVENTLYDPSDPIYVQYADWLWSFVTLDWGTSLRFGDPVAGLLAERAKFTAAYLVPAVILGTIASTVFGYISARREGSLSDGSIRAVSYVVLAVPNFLLAVAFSRYVKDRALELDYRSFTLEAGLLGEWNGIWLSVAAVILGTHVGATQLRQVRAQSSEYFGADFVQMLHAKGIGPRRLARHVLRAAAVPLTSLFVAEVIGVLLVSVFVIEAVLGIPGVGYVVWQAAAVNDAPLVLTATVLVALSILLANLVEDIAAVVLDPRLDDRE